MREEADFRREPRRVAAQIAAALISLVATIRALRIGHGSAQPDTEQIFTALCVAVPHAVPVRSDRERSLFATGRRVPGCYSKALGAVI